MGKRVTMWVTGRMEVGQSAPTPAGRGVRRQQGLHMVACICAKKIENDDDDGAAAARTGPRCELCSQGAASKRLLVRMRYPSVRLRSEFLTGFSSPHCTRSLHFHYIRFTRIAGSSGSAGSSRSVCPPSSHCISVPLLFASSAQTTTLNFLSEQQRASLN